MLKDKDLKSAEMDLRKIIYSTKRIKHLPQREKIAITEDNLFINLLNKYEKGEKDIINLLKEENPKELCKLREDVMNVKLSDYDSFETSINSLEKKNSYKTIYFMQKEEEAEDINIKIIEEIEKINESILENERKIKKYKGQIEERENKIKEKKAKEEREYKELQDELLKYEQLIGNSKVGIINSQSNYKELENKLNTVKDEYNKRCERDKILDIRKESYNIGINYFNKLHNDIQPYKNQMNNEYQEAKGNVRVFCRIRPPLERELTKKQIDIEYKGEESLVIKGEIKNSNVGREGIAREVEQFQFNKVFRQNDTQEEIFEEVSPLIQSSLDGYNINIFAYGQTGSGKTFTMEGDLSSVEKYGIVPRSVDRIFNFYEQELKSMGWEMNFYLTVCEIYNKKIRDLVGEKNVDKTDDLKDIEIHNAKEWNNNFSQIGQRRKVAETKMNMESSRSHLIFKIKIHLHNINEEERYGSLNLIDLAGSERVDKNTVSEERFKESIEINSSLTHLKSVFEAMKSKHDKFVPFHNTPLTDVLKDCLSGDNSKTLMFVNISPLLDSFKESTCSLKFATDVNKCYVTSGKNEDSDEENDLDNGDAMMDID